MFSTIRPERTTVLAELRVELVRAPREQRAEDPAEIRVQRDTLLHECLAEGLFCSLSTTLKFFRSALIFPRTCIWVIGPPESI